MCKSHTFVKLPRNPCSTHTCPEHQECHLIRLPCLIHCDMFPICKERGPVNEIGREIEPTTLQNQVHASRNSLVKRFGQISDLPPDYIRELVKGLSTQEIIQKPFLPSKERIGSVLMRTKQDSKQHPLVFLIKDTNNHRRPFNQLERRELEKKENGVYDLLNRKSFLLIKGPGIQNQVKNQHMNINFDEKNNIESDVPKLGVKSIFDLKPWVETKERKRKYRNYTEKKRPLTYKEAMTLLELQQKMKKSSKAFASPKESKTLIRYSRDNNQEIFTDNEAGFGKKFDAKLEDNTEESEIKKLSWNEFQRQIIELSKDTFRILQEHKNSSRIV